MRLAEGCTHVPRGYATRSEFGSHNGRYGPAGTTLEELARVAGTLWAQAMVVPQPVGPLVSPMCTTDENYGQVPRVYIECSLDNAVSPEFARSMYSAMPCAEVIVMETGHSPFLSAPQELAQHLDGMRRHAAVSQGA